MSTVPQANARGSGNAEGSGDARDGLGRESEETGRTPGRDAGARTEEPTDGEPTDRRRGRSRPVALALGVLVLAVGAGAGYRLAGQDPGAGRADDPAGPAATAEVTRETISATESFGGTLGHGEKHTVAALGQGTITGLAAADSPIERGGELYRLNETPVTALHGALPMYRDLRAGDTGLDVEQLEHNLAGLGYSGFTVDDEFTGGTEDAVRAWQEDIGAEETGFVAASAVVFVPNGARVDSLHADLGDLVAPGAPVLDFTGSDQIVSLQAGMDDRDLLAVDTEVTVELPDGRTIPGSVTSAGVFPAGTDAAGGAGPGGDEAAGAEDAVVEVEVRPAEEVDASLLGTSLDVVAEVDERENVLVVPVSALLALSDGGYGLEVAAGDGTWELVEVDTGLFANGRVEVEGGGIAEGTVVGVAGR
ncbi:peptidoglycan-binding protein [Streptomyces sp. DSM 44917]|uniref:Peptidoglycan-binding protein n=1 Tax=Streptomyces boetiae TaxID=3075541 RepID=A0ABU2LA47_9ACTN|nr:peptidoglycan-binding protein [Streptomyces sp. DSM 44917]MDT0308447.1 peptidoglycan-binding protein [Streptomyces sp. DSM 44917]